MNSLIHIFGIDQDEASDLLVSLGEGTIGYQNLAAAHSYCFSGGHGFERLGREEVTALAELAVTGKALVVKRL